MELLSAMLLPAYPRAIRLDEQALSGRVDDSAACFRIAVIRWTTDIFPCHVFHPSTCPRDLYIEDIRRGQLSRNTAAGSAAPQHAECQGSLDSRIRSFIDRWQPIRGGSGLTTSIWVHFLQSAFKSSSKGACRNSTTRGALSRYAFAMAGQGIGEPGPLLSPGIRPAGAAYMEAMLGPSWLRPAHAVHQWCVSCIP